MFVRMIMLSVVCSSEIGLLSNIYVMIVVVIVFRKIISEENIVGNCLSVMESSFCLSVWLIKVSVRRIF